MHLCVHAAYQPACVSAYVCVCIIGLHFNISSGPTMSVLSQRNTKGGCEVKDFFFFFLYSLPCLCECVSIYECCVGYAIFIDPS